MPRSFTKNIILKTFFLTLCCCSLSTVEAQTNSPNSITDQTDYKKESVIDKQKTQYMSSVPGSIKHKFGYENLDESKNFHHTTTEDDGVRLGCYGYVLNGKKYSTQYVADTKGYRVVYTQDPIDVYPTSGEARKASFVGQFNEDEEESRNIRFFFPDGCQGQKATASAQSSPVVADVPLTAEIRQAPTTAPIPLTTLILQASSSSFEIPQTTAEVVTTVETTEKSTTKAASTTSSSPTVASTAAETTTFSSITLPAHFSDENNCQCQKSTYSMIPVQLKSSGGSCDKFDHLIIPSGVVSFEDLKEINDLLKSKINSY